MSDDEQMAEGAAGAAPAGEMDCSNSDVVTKYKTAAEIVNKTLLGLTQYCKAGVKVYDCCVFGDSLVSKQCESVFKTKKIEKGLAFPTCVSVNECVAHYSPCKSEEDALVLKAGDVVKVDVGAHVDGFIAVAAHTFVVKAEGAAAGGASATGRTADVVKAAYLAAEACVKLIKPGASNAEVTALLKTVAGDFKVSNVQGVLMHELKQFVIDGNNVAINREELEQKVDKFEYEACKVYTVDVVMSTGAGKPIQREERTTVFKRAVDQSYMLKMQASRYVFSEVNKRFATFPFSLRALDDEKKARMGVVECVKHNLFHPYPVLYEKQGDIVAHFKYTVLLLPQGTAKITGLPVSVDEFETTNTVSDAVKELLASSSKAKKKKNKNKKTDAAEGEMETD
jgi:curved DNA binding protein